MNLVRSARAVQAAGHAKPPVLGLALALVMAGGTLAMALAGCAVARPGAAAGLATEAASRASAAPIVAVAPTPTAVQPPTACLTSALAVAPVSKGARNGLDVATFALTNTGARACTISEAPQITPQGPLPGQSSAMEANLAVSQLDLTLPPSADVGSGGDILLQPAQKADFDLGWYSSSTVVCETSDGFGFDAPGGGARSGALLVTYPIGSMCNGLFFVSRVYSPHPAG